VKYDLPFDPPLMNAAGTLGFAPDPYGPVDLKQMGVFITNPVSLGPRTPAQAQRYHVVPGGFLLHTGFPNPGLKAVMRKYAPNWQRSMLPVVVHLLCQGLDDGVQMVRRLEGAGGVSGFELGLPSQVDVASACTLVEAVLGELPLIVRLPLDQAGYLAPQIAASLPSAASGVVFSLGPPRGALPQEDGKIIHGRLFGPGLFPLVFEVVRSLAQAGLRVIAGCGVYQAQQANALLAAGAVGVQLDAVLWRGGF
jgi:dihydroorotate dehydrogenase (NAD+) catalytic subunit